MYPAMEPGMRMMEPGMRPGMMGRGAAPAAEPTAEAVEFQGDPFENSRPNPFVSVLDAQAIRTAGTTYGPDWSQMPLASYLGIGSVQRRPEPEVIAAAEAEEAKFMRIGGIMWTAGRPLAMYEMRTGETGSVAPGDIVDDWQIEQIGQDYVAVRNVVSGESRRLGLRGK